MHEFDFQELAILEEILEEERRAQADDLHNREIDGIFEVGQYLLDYCLTEVQTNPVRLQLEGSLNSLVREAVLARDGWSFLLHDSKGKCHLHAGNSPPKRVEFSPIAQESVPDVVLNAEALRVELKCVSLFTPKDRVPKDFFTKDLAHLDGDGDFDKFEYEGTSRENRRAEMCLMLGDLGILKKSVRLQKLLGKDFDSVTSVAHLRDVGVGGIRYAIELRPFKSSTKPLGTMLCGVLAFPGKRRGERV